MLRVPGPAITPAQALARLAGESTLLLLDACGAGRGYLAWGRHAAPVAWNSGDLAGWLHQLAGEDVSNQEPATGDARGSGWGGFAGGAFVQLDYDAGAVPRAWRISGWVEWDARGACEIVARDASQTAAMASDLARPARAIAAPALLSALTPAWDAAEHGRRVERIRALIARGDIYQANLTLPFIATIAERSDLDIATYIRLTAKSPAPFSAFLRAPSPVDSDIQGDLGGSIVSHSPECFLRVRGERVESLPIKGTRARIQGAEARVRAELLASAKDRAELAMIVDLVRNDLGRVARPGSVVVEDAARVLDLPYAHHLVATVTATLREGLAAGDALASAFPAGSITGAPKIRAMQVIEELESGPRGAYCGVFGWIGPRGCDLAVAIRTLIVGERTVRVHAGGGIIADSDPTREWDEVRTKARAMARALGTELA